jgi:PTS system fructose-specific IIC component
MKYLQNIATALLDKKFNNVILKSTNKKFIIKTISDAINSKPKSLNSDKVENISKLIKLNNPKGLIVGVSSCATGVAHTYMAREALEKHGKDVGYDVWVETQGQSGQEHKLTPELIEKAAAVIIASDINVELERFVGKKIYITNTNEAINKPIQVLRKVLDSKRIQEGKVGGVNFGEAKKNKFMSHFLNGVSHMIPFIVFSGIIYAILNAIGVGIYGSGDIPPNSTLWYAMQVAEVGFNLFTGVMGGYIAMSIAGRAALGPGFIGTVCASTPAMYIFWKGIPDHVSVHVAGQNVEVHNISLGIIAALMMGFSAGYLVNLFNQIKMHKMIKPVLPLIIIPVVCTSLLVFPFQFALSGIMGCAMNYFGAGLAIAGTQIAGRIAIGFVLGAMVGFDMGGPINKIAVATATTLIPVDPSLMGAVSAAIPIAPLGCGLASVVFGRRLFDDNEKGLGVTALALGFMGISEGAIPFAAKRLKQTFICNIIGSAIAGGLACMFLIGGHVGM